MHEEESAASEQREKVRGQEGDVPGVGRDPKRPAGVSPANPESGSFQDDGGSERSRLITASAPFRLPAVNNPKDMVCELAVRNPVSNLSQMPRELWGPVLRTAIDNEISELLTRVINLRLTANKLWEVLDKVHNP